MKDLLANKTIQDNWRACGAIADDESPGVYAAAADEPAVTARTKAAFEAAFKTFDIPERWSYIFLRNSSGVEGDATVYLVYFSDGGDYVPAFRLTFETGTQVNSDKENALFADHLTVEHYLTREGNTIAANPGNNYMAMFGCDRWWAKKIGIVPLTVTNAAFLQITGHGQ